MRIRPTRSAPNSDCEQAQMPTDTILQPFDRVLRNEHASFMYIKLCSSSFLYNVALEFHVKRLRAEMRELEARATNARNEMAIEPFAMSMNASAPNLDIQRSLREAAAEDADIRRYASTCNKQAKPSRTDPIRAT
ncbi:hypothetical protein GW17_00004007 [Ensete ventricosum]|nr:hypothetical protein GW17_00004007 [Ensete ventricosum]